MKELDVWRLTWKDHVETQDVNAAGFYLEMKRQERRMRARFFLTLGTAVVFLALATCFVLSNLSFEAIVWGAVMWLSTAVAAGFSVWNSRVLWKAAGRTTSEYVQVYRKRLMSNLRAVRFGYYLLTIQSIIAVPWFIWDFYAGRLSRSRFAFGLGLTILVIAVCNFVFARSKRQALAELQQSEEFQSDL